MGGVGVNEYLITYSTSIYACMWYECVRAWVGFMDMGEAAGAGYYMLLAG